MKGLRCRKGNYYGEFYNIEKPNPRREYPLGTRDKAQAQQIYLRLQKEFALDTFDPWRDRRPGRKPIDEVVDAFLRTKRDQTQGTQRAYRSTLFLFINAIRASSVDMIKERDVERFIQGKSYTVMTQNSHLQRLNTFARWCIKQGHLQHNPILSYWKRLDQQQPKRRKRGKPRRDFLLPDELQRISAEIQLDTQDTVLERGGKRWSRAWLLAVTELACTTGLREGELCNLNREHVRLRYIDTEHGPKALAGQIMVVNYEDARRGTIETKTGDERIVPLVPRAALLLDRWLSMATDEDPSKPVFVGPRLGRRLDRQSVSEEFTEYRRRSQLRTTLTFHSTRHTFVSWLLMLGLPIYHVKELAGHSGLRITEQYAHTARRYLHGQAREIMGSILTFYCPGKDPSEIQHALSGGLHGGGLGAYAWGGTSLLDVLFGAALYRQKGTPEHTLEAI